MMALIRRLFHRHPIVPDLQTESRTLPPADDRHVRALSARMSEQAKQLDDIERQLDQAIELDQAQRQRPTLVRMRQG